MTPALEAELRDLEAQLLLLEGLKASGKDGPASPIGRSPDEGPRPLSFAQERLWLVDRMVPGSAVYNVPGAVGLAGELDEAVLERCLNEIVRRHATLRTTFETVDGQAVQVEAPPRGLSLPRIDLRALPDRQREREVRRLAAAEAGRPFDLTRGPLLRTLLLELAADDHVLLFTLHHIVSDGWSMGILVRELGALYGAFRRGLPSPLAELPVQYSDFAVWQRRWLSGEVLEAELAFWRGRLAGLPARLELPTDRPHPAVQTFRGGSLSLTLDRDLAADLHALGLEEGATLFMVLLAALQTLLARYAGQEDFGLGTPMAGRSRPEVEGLVGFFVNTLVLRADLTGDPTCRELLARVRDVTLEAYDHQHLPFEKLVEELAPERSLAYAPLFQVTFALQNAPVEPIELPGLAVRPLEAESGTAKLDLVLALGEGAAGLAGTVQYNRDLFDA
ncbi:MAG TPA: condensation domain-containing protein, partial [Thermoanaerobaculia bacterium]|nr:condensation domain-containing protein [Thermoanaerobaculia bacterium]